MPTLTPSRNSATRIAGLRSLCLSGAILAAGAAVAMAATSEITVTRESLNLYRVDGTNTLIKTYDCYEYAAFAEEAVLTYAQESEENTLYFVYSGATCQVDRLLTDDE